MAEPEDYCRMPGGKLVHILAPSRPNRETRTFCGLDPLGADWTEDDGPLCKRCAAGNRRAEETK